MATGVPQGALKNSVKKNPTDFSRVLRVLKHTTSATVMYPPEKECKLFGLLPPPLNLH